MKKFLIAPVALLVLCGSMASAGTITYQCDSSVSTNICTYLNTTIAGQYNNTFTNANAVIFIAFGSTSLGESSQAFNYVSYNAYKSFLTANKSDAIQNSAVLSLGNDTAAYYGGNSGNNNVEVTAALAT